MITKPKVWDLPRNEERITEIRAETKDRRWVLYEYTDCNGRPFCRIVRLEEQARDQRNNWLAANGMTVPKPEPVPASECDDDRCRPYDTPAGRSKRPPHDYCTDPRCFCGGMPK